MNNRLAILAIIILLGVSIAAPVILYADEQTPQESRTAIDKILEYKSGLQLTDSQVHKLELVNQVINQKMEEIKRQASIRKTEIDEFTSNWTTMNGTAVEYIIKEYYQFMADLKNLELEAIMKARAVLNDDQLKKFHDLSSIESMIIKVESEFVSRY